MPIRRMHGGQGTGSIQWLLYGTTMLPLIAQLTHGPAMFAISGGRTVDLVRRLILRKFPPPSSVFAFLTRP
jgi:hypothetical protein